MLRKILFFLYFSILFFNGWGQAITKAEYFFNHDPGFGNGKSISFTGADSISILSDIQIPDSLQPGINILYVRVGSETAWGFPQAYLLNIGDATNPIVKAEYSWNTDPGFGNGTSIAVTGADSISILSDIQVPDSLKPGINVLYVRVGSKNAWGFPQAFLVNIGGATTPIIQAEYFWDTDPGFGKGIPVNVGNPADSMVVLQEIAIPNLSAGEHVLWVRVKNASGTWGIIQQQKINICSIYGPSPKFEHYIDGGNVTFTNLSENAVSYHWNFGNGNSATTVNPLHSYSSPGNYKVILSATNTCGTQKHAADITIAGLQGISPSIAPTTGIYSGKVSGFGFPANAQVSIQLNGGQIYKADTTVWESSKSLDVFFTNNNIAPGKYDVQVTYSGSTYTLEKALTIYAPDPANIWANIAGPEEMLINQWTKFRVIVGNNSNQTAFGVPVLIDVPTTVSAVITSELDKAYLDPSLINEHPNGFFIAKDSLTGEGQNMAYLLIPYIEPGKTAVVNFEVKNPTSDAFKIQLATGKPYYNGANGSFIYQNSIIGNENDPMLNGLCEPPTCIQCLLDLTKLAPNPLACGIGIVDAGCNLYDDIKKRKGKKEKLIDLVLNVASVASNCLPVPDPSKIKTVLGTLKQGISEGNRGFKFANDAGGSCGSCLDPKNPKPLRMRFSWDPNDKTGPTGYGANQYTTLGTGYPYLVQFENLPAATAPASTVVIEDVLDTMKLNPSTFRFTGFGFGDTTVSMDIADTLFYRDIDLRPAKNTIVRVKGHLQNGKKLVFNFSSFDPVTMAATTVIDNGFLPPNTNGTEGLGFVSFLIDPKPDLPTGTLIPNAASIIFDANAPIETGDWVNGIDKEKPQSKVRPDFEKLNDSAYVIKWGGSDGYSGIRHYRIFMSEDGGGWNEVFFTSALLDTIVLKATGSFSFYSISTDKVGNVEEPPGIPDLTLAVVLPVQLLEFTARPEKNTVLLNWITSTERNNKVFDIERSLDGMAYQIVGSVNGIGNSNTVQRYHFTDYPGAAGHYFYRLKQIDTDGRFKYSPVRKVLFNTERMFTVSPNPFSSHIEVVYNQPVKQVVVLDVQGKTLWQSSGPFTGKISITTRNWAAGTYFLQLQLQDGSVYTEKILKF